MRVVGVVSFSHIVCVKVNDVNQLCLDRPVADVLIVLLISFKCWYFFSFSTGACSLQGATSLQDEPY